MSSEPAGSLEEISRCLSLNQDTARLCAVEFGQRSLLNEDRRTWRFQAIEVDTCERVEGAENDGYGNV